MPTDMEERRRTNRRIPACTEALSRIRLRAGRELAVINVSPWGALVEGATRLLPGTNVDVHVTAAQGRVLVRARVIRCTVWRVGADVIVYRGALAFPAPVDLLPIECAATGAAAAEVTTDPQTVLNLRSEVEPMWSGLL
jgi:hypothetical protein